MPVNMPTANQDNQFKPADLPSPSQSALRILRACSDDRVTGAQLAALVASDPLLTAELLRVVNSAYFGMARKIQSIKHAVNILGQSTLRNVVLCISVRDVIKRDAVPEVNLAVFWEDALRHAVCARLLAKMLKIDPEHAFTAGLLQDFGLLVLLFFHPHLSNQWAAIRKQDPQSRYETEKKLFNTTHDQVMLSLGQSWALPDELVAPLGAHHQIVSVTAETANDPLTKVLHVSDWVSAVYTAEHINTVIGECHKKLANWFHRGVEQADNLLATVPEETSQAAAALGLSIEEQVDLGEVLKHANVKLAEANLSYQELTWQLKKTLLERDELAQTLNRELEWAREIQKSLLPEQQEAGFPIVGMNISAKQLSGDFYDYFTLDDGRIYFILGDVSGKGVNAALLMAKISGLFRCLGKRIDDINELISLINAEICETAIRGMFVTVIAGLIDPKTGLLQLVNAGHLPALIVTINNEINLVDAQTPPIGVVPDTDFKPTTIDLAKNSLYLYTDGITESRLASGEELGIQGLVKNIFAVRSKPPMQRIKTIVETIVDVDGTVRDDITMLLVELN